jgi:hypothetical protein
MPYARRSSMTHRSFTLNFSRDPQAMSKSESAKIGMLERFRLGKGITREAEGAWTKEYLEIDELIAGIPRKNSYVFGDCKLQKITCWEAISNHDQVISLCDKCEKVYQKQMELENGE